MPKTIRSAARTRRGTRRAVGKKRSGSRPRNTTRAHGARPRAGSRGRRVRAARRATPRPSPPREGGTRLRALIDLAEDAQARFDEASQHALQSPEFEGLVLDAVRGLGLDRVAAGSIGWTRSLRKTGDASPGAGWLYLVVRPRTADPVVGSRAPSPLLDRSWKEFVYAEECRRIPRAVLAAESSSTASASLVRRFAERVRAVLDNATDE